MGFLSCCCMDNVDWLQEGGLLRCDINQTCAPSYLFCCCIHFNWPFCGSPPTGWMEKKYGQYNYVIFPLMEPIDCCYWFFPCCITRSFLRLCTDEASALVFTHDSQKNTLTSEIRRKTPFDTETEARRSNLTKVHVEEVPASARNGRQARWVVTNDIYICDDVYGHICVNLVMN